MWRSSSPNLVLLLRCAWSKKQRWIAATCVRTARYSKKSSTQDVTRKAPAALDLARVRNIGIMAHIDAGKTTTTERMLYYAGVTRRLGDVDDGDTVTDYLRQERERGITITSAAVSFNWNEHRINLIDTPGHVDFTIEVERSLRVLDGAIAVFDAAAGVQAQSMAVWRQADQYQIPRLIFINKMDKQHADFGASLQSIKEKLHTLPLLTQLPVGQGRSFRGVVDLVQLQVLLWEQDKDGSHYSRMPYSQDLQLGLDVDPVQARRDLVEQVASLDETLLNHIVEEDIADLSMVQSGHLYAALRRCAVGGKGVPVVCGSALRNRGIQPLMDAVTTYLPSPNQRAFNKVPEVVKGPCAFAFKVAYDPQRGPLVFMRIYSGEFKPQTFIYNATRDCKERISRLLLMFADEQREVQSMTEGHIAVAVGLKQTYTGDMLVGSSSAAAALRKTTGEDKAMSRKPKREQEKTASPSPGPAAVPSVFQGLVIPEPVFFCTVEPSSAAQQKDLDAALNCLTHEDPSLRVSTDPDTGQTVLSGMGELHLEIIKDRICSDFKVEASLGRLQVAYRESPQSEARASANLDRWVGENHHTDSCSLLIRPMPPDESCAVEVEWGEGVSLPQPQQEVQKAVANAITSACSRGPLLAYPVINICVVVEGVSVGVATSIPMLSSCVSECVNKAIAKAGTMLMEPVMNIEVTVAEEHLGTVLGDLSSLRRAQIHEVLVRQEARLICAHIPLASLVGYSTALRSLTSGLGSFSSQFSHYAAVGKTLEQTIITQTRGY